MDRGGGGAARRAPAPCPRGEISHDFLRGGGRARGGAAAGRRV